MRFCARFGLDRREAFDRWRTFARSRTFPRFVAKHARTAMERIPVRVREQMPPGYLALEEQRLQRLVTAWLEFERARAEFTVEATELEKPVTVAGLPLKLRLDRLDRLNDDTFLVIDYKTGPVSDRAWNGERPEDLQLPLYAGFGLDEEQDLGGLVFAKLRAGDMCFAGRVGGCGQHAAAGAWRAIVVGEAAV